MEYAGRGGVRFIFPHGHTVISGPFVEETFLSPIRSLMLLLKISFIKDVGVFQNVLLFLSLLD